MYNEDKTESYPVIANKCGDDYIATKHFDDYAVEERARFSYTVFEFLDASDGDENQTLQESLYKKKKPSSGETFFASLVARCFVFFCLFLHKPAKSVKSLYATRMMLATHPALHHVQATSTKDNLGRTLYNKVAYLNQSVVWAFVYIESWLI